MVTKWNCCILGILFCKMFFCFVLFLSNHLMSRTSLEKEQSLANTLCLERDTCTACTVLSKIHSCIVGEIIFYKFLYAEGKSAFTRLHTNLHIDPGCLFIVICLTEKNPKQKHIIRSMSKGRTYVNTVVLLFIIVV